MGEPTEGPDRDDALANERARIVDAAWELACCEGESALTMRRIAQRAGISATHLYTHFADKAALLREVSALADPQLDAALACALEGAASRGEAIYSLCMAHFVFLRGHRWLFTFGSDEVGCDGVTAGARTFAARAQALLHEAGIADDAECIAAAARLRIAIEGLAWAASRSPTSADEDAWGTFAAGYARFLVRGLF